MDHLHTTSKNLKGLLEHISQDLVKADGGNKAASQRVRTNTVKLEKLAKVYRKESIASEKTGKKAPRASKAKAKPAAAKKVAPKKVVAKAKPAPSKVAHKVAPKKAVEKPKAKTATAKPRAFSFKKPTAKLPAKKR